MCSGPPSTKATVSDSNASSSSTERSDPPERFFNHRMKNGTISPCRGNIADCWVTRRPSE